METAKAAVELPSPYAGTVTELLFEAGTMVDVGTPIITIDVGGGRRPRAAAGRAGAAAAADAEPAAGLIGGAAPGGRTAVLVGYGPRNTEARRRPRRAASRRRAGDGDRVRRAADGSARSARPPLLTTAPDAGTKPVRHGGLEVGRQAEAHALARRRRDRPPVSRPAAAGCGRWPSRRCASTPRTSASTSTTVTGTGDGGVITRADVDAAVGRRHGGGRRPGHLRRRGRPRQREQRIPIKGVRKHTAAAMVASAFTAPHVTEFLTVDVTRMMKLRDAARRPAGAGRRQGQPAAVRGQGAAARRRTGTRWSTARWDEAAQEIVVKDYVNLGIAAATPRGLVVPNIKDAGRLSLAELAGALAELTATAREGKTSPADMTGGTITITNVGVFGVDTGTPILNPGESAILAFGAVREMPWVHKGKIVPRQVTQLALSFDHRIIDGELGSRFLADIGALLHDPGAALAF